MTPFCFEHEFRASSPSDLFAAYFNVDQVREQDRRIDILERTVLEYEETDLVVRRVCRVVPRRQLPSFLKPLLSGQLHYIETATWRRQDDEIDIEIRPSLFKGKATITAVYRLSKVGPELIRRRYEGKVNVDIKLVSSKIERGIVAEFERSMPLTAAATQEWLDRTQIPGSPQA